MNVLSACLKMGPTLQQHTILATLSSFCYPVSQWSTILMWACHQDPTVIDLVHVESNISSACKAWAQKFYSYHFAIGPGFTATHLGAFKCPEYKWSRPSSCTSPSFFYCYHSNSHYSHSQHSSSFSSHNWDPTHLSILYIFHTHLPIPHLHLHRTTVLQLSVSLYIFILLKLSRTACRFSLNGSSSQGYHALMCTIWYHV